MKAKDRLNDIKSMDTTSLEKELLELGKEQFNLRMQQATGQLANTSRVKQVRRDIARIKTIMNQSKGKTA